MEPLVRLIGPIVLIAGIIVVIEVMRRCADGRIGVNMWAGLRTPAIMTDEHTWKAGHAAALPTIQGWGIAALVLGIVAALLPWDAALVATVLASAVLILIGCVRGTVLGTRAANELLAARSTEDPSHQHKP